MSREMRAQERVLENFVQPKTLSEARERKSRLVAELERIQVSLGDRNKLTPTGERMTEVEWWTWRRKAVFALDCLRIELRAIKEWISKHAQRTDKFVHGKVVRGELVHSVDGPLDLNALLSSLEGKYVRVDFVVIDEEPSEAK